MLPTDVNMAEPSSSVLEDLERRLQKCILPAEEELYKGTGSNGDLVDLLQMQAQFLLADISGEVQYHEVCAVLSSIICLRLSLASGRR